MPKRILALDLATHLGWAFWAEDEPAMMSGHHKLKPCPVPGGNVNMGKFVFLYEEYLNEALIERFKPDIIVFEASVIPFSAGGLKTSFITVLKLLGLTIFTEYVAYKRNLRCFMVKPPIWKKHFIGFSRRKGVDMKKECIAECERRGLFPDNDNEADAIGLLDYSCHALKIATGWRDRGLLGHNQRPSGAS